MVKNCGQDRFNIFISYFYSFFFFLHSSSYIARTHGSGLDWWNKIGYWICFRFV